MISTAQIVLQTQIPEALSPRETSFSWILGSALFLSLIILALARVRQANVYYAISVGLIKTQSARIFFREAMPLRSGASILLLINYCISGGLLVYLISEYFRFGQVESWIAALVVPAGIFLFHFFSLSLTGWITGEIDIFRAPIVMKIIGAQGLGIVYFILATFWILQPDYVSIILNVVIWAFLVESSLRIIKSVSVVLRQGVTWYYIILYFCTLEILPFLVGYYYLMQNL